MKIPKSFMDELEKLGAVRPELSEEELVQLSGNMNREALRERLADLEHRQWAHFTKYLLKNFSPKNLKRWERQANTPYSDLSNKEKDSDREWADKVLKLVKKDMAKTAGPYKELDKHRTPLTPEERAEVMRRKAIWHHGPNGAPSPAVWKSVNPRTGATTYITNTHRAMNSRPTLRGAISRYHRFIKGTS